jgi:hypothetical protein
VQTLALATERAFLFENSQPAIGIFERTNKCYQCCMLRFSFLSFLIVLSLTNCRRTDTATTTTTPKPSHSSLTRQPSKVDACTLLSKEEVGAIQNTTVTDAKGSEQSDGSHLITQCYYATTGTNLSVSIAVTQFDPNNVAAPSPRDYWEQTFGRFRKEKNETEKKEHEEKGAPNTRGGGREEGEEGTPPKKMDGVGEEAFWAGNRVGGALYVLKGDVFIRISVGGPGNEQAKLERSRQLAQKALMRLP